MRLLALVGLLAVSTPAHAELSKPTSGVWLQFGGGLASASLREPATGMRYAAGTGWHLGFGGFVGRYDDSFAIGRQVAFGLQVRQEAYFPADDFRLRTVPMFEVRRGIDLLVATVHVGGAIGPLLDTEPDEGTRLSGGTARVVGAAHYRFSRLWSAIVRLEAGVDAVWVDQGSGAAPFPSPTVGLTLGLQFSAPTHSE
jgi:hypothetical protein